MPWDRHLSPSNGCYQFSHRITEWLRLEGTGGGDAVQPSPSRVSCQEPENYFHSAFKHGKTGILNMLKIIWCYRKWSFFICPSGGRKWPSSTFEALPHTLAPLTRSAAVLMPTCCVLCLAAARICHYQGCPSILNGEFFTFMPHWARGPGINGGKMLMKKRWHLIRASKLH